MEMLIAGRPLLHSTKCCNRVNVVVVVLFHFNAKTIL